MGFIVWTIIAAVLTAWVWELLSWQPGSGGDISEIIRDSFRKRERKRLEKLQAEYDEYVIQEQLVTTRYNREVQRIREYQIAYLHNLNAYERQLLEGLGKQMNTLDVLSYELEFKEGRRYEYVHYTPARLQKVAN